MYSEFLSACLAAIFILPQLVLADSEPMFNQTQPLSFDIQTSLKFPYTIIQDETSVLTFNYSYLEPNNTGNDAELIHLRSGWRIKASVDNHKIAEVWGPAEVFVDPIYPYGSIDFEVSGKLPGRVTLLICAIANASTGNSGKILDFCPGGDVTLYKLFVERRERPIDIAFNVVVVLLVVLTNVGMGAKIDFEVVKSELRRPIAPAIGLCCQFIIMPMISFAVASSISLDPGIALGFLALGCAPGGSASNAYTHLLDGNVSLSVTMTLISTIAALGLLPMWLFTLGKVVYDEGNVTIPFQNIFFSLLGIIIPVTVGLLLQRKCPKAAKMCVNAVKYIVFIFIVFVLTVGVYANIYIFSLLNGQVLLAAALLPYLGFLLGGLVACVLRQGKVNIITIAVETGIQNTGIPIVLLRLSLMGPDKDTSIVAPVASALFTPIPLVIGILYVQGKIFLEKRRKKREAREGKESIDNPEPV
ncbi:ileal sodium/bile acid cotransporter-like isoform X2 [Physella acuta]|uniref:ileal sodium/bile acid cotransporter-like isoform X2 n=1 Tax=Physella acuta TaxID=109671 RepID=UPI0027DE8A1E|nr:ileal sodium/bile acid cotransporter-like isoform X2 [Physella acuta]